MKNSIYHSLLAAGLLAASTASGAINITLQENGSDVVLSYSGTISGTLGNERLTTSPTSSLWPQGSLFRGNNGTNASLYYSATPSTVISPLATNLPSFGTGSEETSVALSGDRFGIYRVQVGSIGPVQALGFAPDFNGNGSFSGTITASNATFDTLGIDSQFGTFSTTYDFTITGGTATGSFDFTVVPEPSAYASLLGLAAAGLAALRRRRRA